MSDFKDDLFMAGGRRFIADVSDKLTSVNVVEGNDGSGKKTFVFNIKFTVSGTSAEKAMLAFGQLDSSDQLAIKDMTNVVVMKNVFLKDGNTDAFSGKLSFAALPIGMDEETEPNLTMTIELGYKNGGKTKNKTKNGSF